MPESKAPPLIQEADLQRAPLYLTGDVFGDDYAKALVNQTFNQLETFRRNNHDPRWQSADSMYYGIVERKLWEGTEVPRASLAMPLVFDQVEAATPLIMQALFGDSEWFDLEAVEGTDPKVLRDIRDHLKFAAEAPADDFGVSPLAGFEYVIKQLATYGNGAMMVEYDGMLKRPVPSWVDIRDLYFDTGATSSSVQDMKCLIHRRNLSVNELYELRGSPGMKIPSKEVLTWLAENRPISMSDVAKQTSEAIRKVQYLPGVTDMLPLPADQNIEVLQYWSPSRCIWLLNRMVVAYNEPNVYKFIPYCVAPCFSVPGRAHAMSYPDVMGDTQLYAQSLRNLRLDELSLSVNPPRTRAAGSNQPLANLRWRPGMLAEFEDPQKDMAIHLPNGASAGVADEIAQLVMDAEKRTGVSAMSSGVPNPSNANRTLGGMQMQAQGGSSRLSPLVKHVEDFIIAPMVAKMYRMTQIHMRGKQDGRLPVGKGKTVPATSFNAEVQVKVNAASKMMTRAQLGQILPFLTQYLMQGPLMQALQTTGQTVDWEELLNMLQDATGVRTRYRLIRPMNQQEQQAMNQPDPATAAKMQQAQMDQQTRLQMGQMKAENEKNKYTLEYQARSEETDAKDSREILKFLLEIIANQNDNTREKIQAELAGKVQEMNMKQQQSQMDMFMKQKQHEMSMAHDGQRFQMDAAMQGHKAQMDMAVRQQQAQMGMQQAQAEAEHSMAVNRQQREQDLAFSNASKQQDLMSKSEQNRLALEQQKAMNKLGAGKPPRDTQARAKRKAQHGG